MRVFYVEDDDEIQERTYYVKIDNINVIDELKGTIVIKAKSVKDLMFKIKKKYGFKDENMKNIQLWSAVIGVVGRERLDEKEMIPEGYEDIWIRGVTNNNDNK